MSFTLELRTIEVVRLYDWRRGVFASGLIFANPLIIRGPTSFDDLCTFDGVLYHSFKSTCIACGLLDSDEQWDRSLTEAVLWQNGSQLQELFVCILLHCHPASALQLWTVHAQSLSDNCCHRLQTIHQIADPSEEQVQLHFHIF